MQLATGEDEPQHHEESSSASSLHGQAEVPTQDQPFHEASSHRDASGGEGGESVGSAPRTPVDDDEGAGGGDPETGCPNVDITTRDEFSALLLHCVASEMVNRDADLESALRKLRKAILLASSDSHRIGAEAGLVLLRGCLDKVASKKYFGAAVAHVMNKEQQTAKVGLQMLRLEQSGFGTAARSALAAKLIAQYVPAPFRAPAPGRAG
jgi:hypothetical protein